jgi:adenosylhomocysteine nucleosidase
MHSQPGYPRGSEYLAPGLGRSPLESALPWLLVAVAREHLLFRKRIRIEQTLRTRPTALWRCRLDQREFILGETGVGGTSVGTTLDWLRPRIAPVFAVFSGFAGALVPDLRVGDVVRATGVVDPAGTVSETGFSFDIPGRVGRLLTSDVLVALPAAKAELARRHDALAVDMESSYFAAWCQRQAVPWACVRVVSDDAHTPISKDVFELLEDGRVSAWRLMKAIVRRRAILGELRHLGRATHIASQQIAEILTAAARHHKA